MDTIFLAALIIYLSLFIILGIMDVKKVKNFSDFVVAGRSHGTVSVTMTLFATIIGASTTIGICDTVYSIGFPGIWWLMFGAVGLILQSFLLSEKVRGIGAVTLPDLARKTVGPAAEMLLALIIVISWVGVIAGQLVAMKNLISLAVGNDSTLISIIVSVIILLYTLTGGQRSVVRTDKIQFLVIIAGIVISMIFLYTVKGDANAEIFSNIELLNKDYTPVNLFTQLFVIGGVYFIGPDIMSRNFISKDKRTARISALAGGIFLIIFSIIITMIGMWIKVNVPADQLSGSALFYIRNVVPRPLSILLILGLLSAILSSTDTCLINASSIFTKDILKKENVGLVRVTTLVIGILAALLAFGGRSDIMSLLTGAYSIYTPGVIFPLTVAIFCHNRRHLHKEIWLIGVILGGMFGITSTYLIKIPAVAEFFGKSASYLSLMGMGVSLVISLLSIRGKISDAEDETSNDTEDEISDDTEADTSTDSSEAK
ncbi:MAG: sodium:solute symporter family protein [Eubacterium sp.]|nr:sodium:solute symporter family protein [Eubacterium sp.]